MLPLLTKRNSHSRHACSTTFFLFLLICVTASAQKNKILDSVFQDLHRQGAFNGCIIVAEDGKPIYEKAFGYANFETKQTLNNQSIFELASVSKQFTAMAIMQLHQKKKLSYTDDIRKYLPSLSYEGITIDHLLHHTSGIPEFLGWDEQRIDVNRINYNQDILAALVKNHISASFKPGEYMVYSNTNYILLALIVEKVSGLPFADYMKTFVFKPLNMVDTYVYPQRSAAKKLSNYAYGHVYNPKDQTFILNDRFSANKYQRYFDGSAGAYGISSSTEDLLKWDQGLYTEKLISKAEQELAYAPSKLTSGKIATLNGLPYGFGWLILPTTAHTGKRYMHTGGYPGYQTIICRYPEKHKTIVILTNTYNVINIYALCFAVENILFDRPFNVPKIMPFKNSVVISPADLKVIEGIYALTPQYKFTITADQGQAYAQLPGQVKAEIYPESELEFFYTIVPARLKFVKDSSGQIQKLILFQNGKQLTAMKENF